MIFGDNIKKDIETEYMGNFMLSSPVKGRGVIAHPIGQNNGCSGQ